MRRLLFCLMLLSFVFIANSQDLKTFNGKFAGEIGLGNATYSYYIDSDGNEIRHGNYKFVETYNSSDRGSYSATLTGTFRNGLKHGAWTYSRTLNDALSGRSYITSTTNVKMNYQNGVPEGSWSYSQSGKFRERLYSLSGWRWGNYQPQKSVSIQLNWKEGTIVGNLHYKTPYVNTVGQLNSNGQWIGKWIIDGQEYILEEGIVISGIRDQEGRFENHQLVDLRKQYKSLPRDERESFSLENRLKVDTIRGVKHYDINDGYFNNRVFNCNETAGKYEKRDEINYGYYVVIQRAKIISLKDLLRNVSIDYRPIDELENLLENNKIHLTNEDAETFKKLIDESRIKRVQEAEEKQYITAYEKLYHQLLKLTEVERINCPFPVSPLQRNSGSSGQLTEIDDFINNLEKDIDWRAKYFSNGDYQISDFSNYGYNPEYGRKEMLKAGSNPFTPIVSTKESYEKLLEYMQFVESKYENKGFVGKLYACFPEEIRSNMYKVEYEYRINPEKSGFESLLGVKLTNRNKLYIPYFETLRYQLSNVNKESSFDQLYDAVNEINDLCLFMLDNAKKRTKDIEKELGATDKVEDWVEIFKRYIKR